MPLVFFVLNIPILFLNYYKLIKKKVYLYHIIIQMSATEIKLYDFFRKVLKLVDARAKVFTRVLYESIENTTANITANYKSEIQTDLHKMELQLRTEIKDSKTDMKKWFFAFFVTLVLMILRLYATILLK